ncbi:MAG: hypothetical protein ACIALR_04955 [Blastopirellula sp. JB062]
MGFTVYYRSTEPVSDKLSVRISDAAGDLCRQRDWLSCEAVRFDETSDGHMQGGCKPNFSPHPQDVDSFEKQDLPDGTLHDALDVLCELSREHQIDWSFSHDHDQGPIGFIVDGKCDDNLLAQIETLDELVTMISGVEGSNVETPSIYVEADLVDDLGVDDLSPGDLSDLEEGSDSSAENPAILKFPS